MGKKELCDESKRESCCTSTVADLSGDEIQSGSNSILKGTAVNRSCRKAREGEGRRNKSGACIQLAAAARCHRA
jgi:hypothetical protein